MHDNKERPKVIKILNLEGGPSPLTIYQIKLHGNGHIIPKTSDLCGSAFCPKGLISYPLPPVPWPVKALPWEKYNDLSKTGKESSPSYFSTPETIIWEKCSQETRRRMLPTKLGVQASRSVSIKRMGSWEPRRNHTPNQQQEIQVCGDANNCSKQHETNERKNKQGWTPKATYPIMKALARLFVFSLRKYMQAAKETATYTENTSIKQKGRRKKAKLY